jgi:biotin carboxyl carrier protein
LAYGCPRSGHPAQRRWPLARYFLRLGDREVEADLEETPQGLRVNLDGEWRTVGLQRLGDSPRYVLTLDDRLVEVLVEEETRGFNVQLGGASYQVETVRGGRRGRDQSDTFVDGVWLLRAPLTGLVSDVRVAVGDTVERGDVLMVVEAMKMLNDLKSRVGGTVSLVKQEGDRPVQKGDRVEIGDILVELREEPAT